MAPSNTAFNALPLYCSGLPGHDRVHAVVHALAAALRGARPPRRVERRPRLLQHHRRRADAPRVRSLTSTRNLLLGL